MKKLILAAAVAAAFVAAPSVFAQNLAIVNGKAVPTSRVDVLIQQSIKAGNNIPPQAMEQARAQAKNEAIQREIFMQESQRRGFDATDDFKNQIELARQTILIRELFTEMQRSAPVSDDEIKAEYDKAVAANAGKEYHAHHILVPTEAEAKDVLAKLKKKASFEELAKTLSKDAGSGANGGDLDWANPKGYVPEFAAALVKLTKGQISAPVQTKFGWHIIRLDDTREAKLPTLDQVKPQIAQQLGQQKMGKLQEEIQSKAKIEPSSDASVAGVVNGQAVPASRIDAILHAMARANNRPIPPEALEQVKAQAKDEVLKREVFMQAARAKGLDATEDYKNQLELARQTLLIRELFNDEQKNHAVTEAEVKAEYDRAIAANPGKEYRVHHILVATETEAKDVLAKLKKKAKFEDLAKALSKDPGSGANGGDLEWVNAAGLVKEFADAMVKLSKGQTTEAPVQTQYGWHIIRLDDVREPKLPALAEVTPQINQQLMQQKMEAFAEGLRAKAKIE